MSGYIINPYSADFLKTANISYSIESIPIVAYGLIGVTTLGLAYVTFLESAIDISKSASEGMSSILDTTKSATSLLPSFSSATQSTTTQSSSSSSILPPSIAPSAPAPAAPVPQTRPPGVMGGKSRRKKQAKKQTIRKRK